MIYLIEFHSFEEENLSQQHETCICSAGSIPIESFVHPIIPLFVINLFISLYHVPGSDGTDKKRQMSGYKVSVVS